MSIRIERIDFPRAINDQHFSQPVIRAKTATFANRPSEFALSIQREAALLKTVDPKYNYFADKRIASAHLYTAFFNWLFQRTEHEQRMRTVEIGAGSTGDITKSLLQSSLTNPEHALLEINPSACDSLTRIFGDYTVHNRSYFEMGREFPREFERIYSLSSLDCTGNLAAICENLTQSMPAGAVLAIVQDVGVSPVTAFDSYASLGHNFPGNCLTGPHGIIHDLYALQPTHGNHTDTFITPNELFREHLGQTITNTSGLTLKENTWIRISQPLSHGSKSQCSFQGCHFTPEGEAYRGLPREELYLTLTIAEKVD